MHLNAEELKLALIGSENERPNKVESLRDTPLFPCKHKSHGSIISLEKVHKTMNKKQQCGRLKQTSLRTEKEAGTREAA